jgi:hypothetical protein
MGIQSGPVVRVVCVCSLTARFLAGKNNASARKVTRRSGSGGGRRPVEPVFPPIPA